MNVDQFYRITHLFVCILTVIIILNIWYKYFKMTETSGEHEKVDFSLLFFVVAIVIWEVNLYDDDMQFESLSGTIAVSFMMLGFNFIELNLKAEKVRRFNLLYIAITTLTIICVSRVLYAIYPENILIGFSVYIFYLAFGFIYSSIKAFKYFRAKNFPLLGFLSIILFAGLYLSIIGSAYNVSTASLFELYKSIYLIASFGLLSILITLAYVWINTCHERFYANIFSDQNVTTTIGKDELLDLLVNDKIQEAIENIIYFKKVNNLAFTDIYLIAARNKRLENKNRAGVLSLTDYQLERNKILADTIALVEHVF